MNTKLSQFLIDQIGPFGTFNDQWIKVYFVKNMCPPNDIKVYQYQIDEKVLAIKVAFFMINLILPNVSNRSKIQQKSLSKKWGILEHLFK